jgi:hypothetical protein
MSLYVIALLPQMATDASERALYFPSIGASILLALLVTQIGPIARRIAPGEPRAPRLSRVAGWYVVLCVLVPGIILSATMPYVYTPTFEKPNRQAESILSHLEEQMPDHLVILNTPGPMHTFYLHPIIEFHAGPSLDVRVLSSMNGIMSVERIDDSSFVLRADRSGWLTNFFAGILRAPVRLNPDRAYDRGVLRAQFAELTSNRRDVLAVRFGLNRPLDDPGMLVMRWDGESFRPLNLSTVPVGETITLADTSDVWSSMW